MMAVVAAPNLEDDANVPRKGFADPELEAMTLSESAQKSRRSPPSRAASAPSVREVPHPMCQMWGSSRPQRLATIRWKSGIVQTTTSPRGFE